MKKLGFLFFLLFGGLVAIAQPGDEEMGERVESAKIGFITNKLNLTPQESQQFWPIYNAHQAKIKALREGLKETKRAAKKDLDGLSDADIEKGILQFIEVEEKTAALQRVYLADLKKVLPMKKIGKLFKAEQQFRRELMERMRDRRGGGDDAPPPPPRRPGRQ
jgi:hypothetical protein